MIASSRLSRSLATLFASLVLAGCGTNAASICSDICECQGCSEEEEQDCVDDVEDAVDAAEDEGCSDQADELLACYGDELECRDGSVDIDGCQSEIEALAKCTGAGAVVTSGGSGGGAPGGNREGGGSPGGSGGSGGAPPGGGSPAPEN